MLFENKYKKNLKRFMFYIDEKINKADAKYSTAPSCRSVLLTKIDVVIANSKSQIEKWNAETDVESLAIKTLYNAAFDILSSGRLHVYRGVLDPSSCANQLVFIVDECLDYYEQHGFASKKQVKDQKEILTENISNVG